MTAADERRHTPDHMGTRNTVFCITLRAQGMPWQYEYVNLNLKKLPFEANALRLLLFLDLG